MNEILIETKRRAETAREFGALGWLVSIFTSDYFKYHGFIELIFIQQKKTGLGSGPSI